MAQWLEQCLAEVIHGELALLAKVVLVELALMALAVAVALAVVVSDEASADSEAVLVGV